ncbi:hypothetical protein SAMN05444340_1211 [Citreimonas salinaria]|uniref:Uncharacterized protein n=1 Tax=Citreimonas salinaria TaxID=321339 RepID=A0A1H3N637_9RHOB|nr:hypothetical protein SAMN05444340_1211 [Citreimonas salinaria]
MKRLYTASILALVVSSPALANTDAELLSQFSQPAQEVAEPERAGDANTDPEHIARQSG